MIFVKFACLIIKSKLAVNGRSVRPVKKLDASAFDSATSQPVTPSASDRRALSDLRLAGERVWTLGQPVRSAVALYAETACAISSMAGAVLHKDTLVSSFFLISSSGSGSGCLGIALALLDAAANVFSDLAFPPFAPAETRRWCASFVSAKIFANLGLLRRPFSTVKNSSRTTFTTV